MQTMPFLESCPSRAPPPKSIVEDHNKDCRVRRERKILGSEIKALHSWRGHF